MTTNSDKAPAKKKRDDWEVNKDIVCFPMHEYVNNEVLVPRGKARTALAKLGLMGKLRLTSEMSPEDVKNEISSVFSEVIFNKDDFKFAYLQSAGRFLICYYYGIKPFYR